MDAYKGQTKALVVSWLLFFYSIWTRIGIALYTNERQREKEKSKKKSTNLALTLKQKILWQQAR